MDYIIGYSLGVMDYFCEMLMTKELGFYKYVVSGLCLIMICH